MEIQFEIILLFVSNKTTTYIYIYINKTTTTTNKKQILLAD